MIVEAVVIIVLIILGLLTLVNLPGPMLIAIATLIYGFATDFAEFSVSTAIVFLTLGVIGIVIDNVFTLVGAKKFGASKWGILGAFAGMFLVFVIGPVGIVVGPPLGAFLAELLISKLSAEDALKAAVGTIIGFLTGLIAKFSIALVMIIWFAITVL